MEPEEEEYVTIPKLQYQQLQQRVRKLENYVRQLQLGKNKPFKGLKLKTSISEQQQVQYTIQRRRPTVFTQHQCKCHNQNKKANPPQQSIKQLISWSKNFHYKQSRKESVYYKTNKQKLQKIAEEEQYIKQERVQQEKIRLIEQICLYGPQKNDLIFENEKTILTRPKLYFPTLKNKYEGYSQIFFPEGVEVKKTKSSQIYQTIFKKTAVKQQIAIILLLSQAKHIIFKEKQHQLLKQSNPNNRLFAYVVYFNDIVQVTTQENTKKTYNAQFCLAIFTYFPLVSLMEDIIVSLLEQIKIRRLKYFTQDNHEFSKVNISYMIEQLYQVRNNLMIQLNQFHPEIGSEYELSIGEIKININLHKQYIEKYMIEGWVYQILKMLNKQLFYDILTAFMLEKSLCVICQDLHFLTYFIWLFSDLLIRPLSYPFKIICLSKEQYYGCPYAIVQGVNKDNKWLSQNSQFFKDQIVINLNDKISIKSKEKLITLRSQPLKTIVRSFYKDIQNLSNISFLFKVPKRQSLKKPCSEGQNRLLQDFLNKVKQYFDDQITKHLPKFQIIQVLQKQSDQQNKVKQSKNLLNTILKYLHESRKNKQKDIFLQQIFQQTAFQLFLCQFFNI